MKRMKGVIAAAALVTLIGTGCEFVENKQYRVVGTSSGLQAQIVHDPSAALANTLWYWYCATNMPCTGKYMRDNFVPSGWGRAEWVEGTYRYDDLYAELNEVHFHNDCLALNKGWSGNVWWSHFITDCFGNGSGGGSW